MNLHQLYFTNNACYKANKKMTVKGIMVHSTGCNNPWLKRYVGPDDGLLGKNVYNNHWNTERPSGRSVCVHGFIGKLNDGSIATYQTLPWDICGWHSGSGNKGNANFLGYIGFEICEDGLADADYFGKVYREAVELCAYLCKKYNLDPLKDGVIIGHYEGYNRGIASNHGDPKNWFPKFGKSMDSFRKEVSEALGSTEEKPTETTDIQVGDLVSITGTHYYGGQKIPTWVKNSKWYVCSIANDRVVINKDETGRYAIMSPVKASDLKVEKSVTSPAQRTHTVVHGDTLWGISKKYLGKGNRYPEIKALNGLTSNVIYTGMVLKIPN